MAMSVGGRKGGAIADINVTPMADIMIVLLIIFMVMTPLIVSAPVALPDAENATTRKDDRVEVVLTQAGEIRVGKAALGSVEALAAYLRERLGAPGDAPPTVLIQADRGVDYQNVLRVLDACRAAGAEEVGLAAQKGVSVS